MKIEIYYQGDYVCTTTQAKDVKEARQNFIKNPSYVTLVDGWITRIVFTDIWPHRVTCRIPK